MAKRRRTSKTPYNPAIEAAGEAGGTARQGARSTDIVPAMLQAAQAGLNTIRAADTAWMGPGQPVQPSVPDAAGRQYDYPVAVNLNMTPRSEEGIGFPALRGLADAYFLVRLAIETRKDQMVKLKWSFKPTDPKKKPDARCDTLNAFFASPDKRHTFREWLRMLLEDMLVIDAATVYNHETNNDTPHAFEIIDGATIKVLLDQYGRTPLPPDAAYQQNLKGVPAVNYTSDEIVYKPRNPRSHKAYGYSPVEQVITIVNIGLRREISQLQFYTEGNIPEMIAGTPNTWNPDQIKVFQAYWDSLFEGNTASRRRAKFVPGGMDIHETKTAALTDAFDEWLARVIMFAFSLPPTAFVKQNNRATADSAKEQAEEEGLAPVMLWVEDYINFLKNKYFPGCEDLAFAWTDEKSIDPLVQSTIHTAYLNTNVMTPNEVRADLGMEARDYEAEEELKASKNPPLMVGAPTLDENGLPVAPAAPGAAAPKDVTPPKPGDDEPPAGGKKKPAAKAPPVAAKASRANDMGKKQYAKMSAANVRTAEKLAGGITKTFKAQKPVIIASICDAYASATKVAKAEKPTGENIASDADVDFSAVLTLTAKNLKEAALEGVDNAEEYLDGAGGAELDAEAIAEGVGDYNAAEMVGNIDAATRDMLANNIDEALKEGWTTDELASVLADNYAFSDARADTIARTEVAKADMAGSMKAYRESGVVKSKKWLLAEAPCEICEGNADDGIIDLDDDFSSGDDAAPAHPNCECDVAPVIEKQTDDNKGDDDDD